MVLVPNDRELSKITWVTCSKVQPNRLILCQGCKGIILFNIEELQQRRATGQTTSTPCQVCGYHPGWPPEPHYNYDGKIEKEDKTRYYEFAASKKNIQVHRHRWAFRHNVQKR